MIPHDGEKPTVGNSQLTLHVEDTKNYNVDLYQFAHALGKETSNVLFWTVAIVNLPQEMPNVRCGHRFQGSFNLVGQWSGGHRHLRRHLRQAVNDDGVSKRLTLKMGQNVIRAAVINGGGAAERPELQSTGNGPPRFPCHHPSDTEGRGQNPTGKRCLKRTRNLRRLNPEESIAGSMRSGCSIKCGL